MPVGSVKIDAAADAYSAAEEASGKQEFVMTVTCPDKQGVGCAVSHYLLTAGCHIVDSQQFVDQDTGLFFTRVAFSAKCAGDPAVHAATLRTGFAATADDFRMECQIYPADRKMHVLIMVSKFGHCLNDLLFRSRIGALPAEIVAVVSNHRDFEDLVASYGVPFHHIPVAGDTRQEAEARLLSLIESERIELIVLARYMQVLSDGLCERLAGRIVNIHHSLLPSFKGAKPYHQAHDRGVKLIGATAHYVTADLDEGPIIEQEVARVGHGVTPAQLVAVGRDVECQALARAVGWHSDHRVLLNGRRTVVFA